MRIPFTNKHIVSKDRTFGNTDYPQQQGGSIWYPIDYLENLFGKAQYIKDFLEVPELNAVINILAKAEASGTIDAFNKISGKPHTNNESLVRILRKPNWFQGSLEFWRQNSLWRSIYGNEYIYFFKPVGMPNSFQGMFTIDPASINIRYPRDELFFNVADNKGVKYIYTLNGQEYELETENVIHLNDNRVQANNMLKGVSKLDSLQPAIKNIRAAYRKRNIALNMPIGILANTARTDGGTVAPLQDSDKKEAQMALKSHGALPILTNLAIKYEAMTVNSAQLGLFEEVHEDTMRICDAYGVPYEMLSSKKGNALSDSGGALKEAKKQMFEETAIPNVNERIQAINNMLMTATKAWEIQAHFSHLPVFAEDKKQFAISFKLLVEGLSKVLADGVITEEQYMDQLVKFGIDKQAK